MEDDVIPESDHESVDEKGGDSDDEFDIIEHWNADGNDEE